MYRSMDILLFVITLLYN